MRKSSFLFLSLLLTSPLHAETTVDLTSALSESEGATSEWQQQLQQARSQSFDKAASGEECVFYDVPKIAAPDWICGAAVAGVDTSAVGTGRNEVPVDQLEQISEERGDYINRVDAPIKAYMNALIAAYSVVNVSTSVSRDEATERVTDRITKQTTSMASLSENVRLSQMAQYIVEYDESDKESNNLRYSVTKLAYQTDSCKALIKQFTKFSKTQKPGVAESMVSRGSCNFHQIVDDMSASGWKLLKMAKSPDDTYYALVGYIEPVDDQYSEAGLNNDKKLWEQFKASTGGE